VSRYGPAELLRIGKPVIRNTVKGDIGDIVLVRIVDSPSGNGGILHTDPKLHAGRLPENPQYGRLV
jgi:hypothetical protein